MTPRIPGQAARSSRKVSKPRSGSSSRLALNTTTLTRPDFTVSRRSLNRAGGLMISSCRSRRNASAKQLRVNSSVVRHQNADYFLPRYLGLTAYILLPAESETK